jgi:hypothetical protein
MLTIIKSTSKTTTIELSADELKLFRQFKIVQPQFKILYNEGLFSSYIGSKTVHKNGGDIKQVDYHGVTRY